ncbi:MAG: hypothetical protein L0271_14990 [Gemmatimonadetes bacterium]|nr:hypothetical protein [Gemmatimonadota bacterium]
MPTPRRISVAISGRNNDTFPSGTDSNDVPLSQLRSRIKREIEAETLFGEAAFDVWINEEGPTPDNVDTLWDQCLDEMRRADMVLALVNGNAGWSNSAGDMGICHAELKEAMDIAPAKVRRISLEPHAKSSRRQDVDFRNYLDTGRRIMRIVEDGESLVTVAKAEVRDAVTRLVGLGVREAKRGKYHSGTALDWSLRDLQSRKATMETAMCRILQDHGAERLDAGSVVHSIAGQSILIRVHAIPDALSVSAARELVGQPQLRDHLEVGKLLKRTAGPIHMIACHKGVTERQASSVLGSPDATFVKGPFGVFVADGVHKTQLVFVRDCRDEGTMRNGIQRFLEWVDETAEDDRIVDRARSRARIVRAIAKEL